MCVYVHFVGARVVMITGDAEATAVAIAKQAGIYQPGQQRIISGREIEELIRSGEDALAGTFCITTSYTYTTIFSILCIFYLLLFN